MDKQFNSIIQSLRQTLNSDKIDQISKKVKFTQRKSIITITDFLMLNVFYGSDICTAPLSQLTARFEKKFSTSISRQALHNRFNEYSVEFMKEVFKEIMYIQNTTLQSFENKLKLQFNRIIVNDATSFNLPKEFEKEFPGLGGSSSPSAIKIQLQYEILSGSFMKIDFFGGKENDTLYLNSMKEDSQPKDLKLADLGYFKTRYLKEISENGSSFISKVKSNTSLYKKNPNPDKDKFGCIKKSSEYIKLDILELAKPLSLGETTELKDIYIGSKKELKSRLIITKLTKENKGQRENKIKKNMDRKKKPVSQKTIDFSGVNAYITNVENKILTPTQVHDIYSLRWQIELIFKVWKSIFKINQVKKVKIERFKCFLYGRLIAYFYLPL